MTAGAIRIAIVAGEASGDLLASHLIPALKARLPKAVFYGIGGPKMIGQGFDAWYPLESLAVRGYVEVLRHYREISGIRRDLKRRLIADPPDVFIGVDAPDFNLALEKSLKRRHSGYSLRGPIDLGVAWQAYSQDRRGCFANPGLVSIRAGSLRKARYSCFLCRSSFGGYASG